MRRRHITFLLTAAVATFAAAAVVGYVLFVSPLRAIRAFDRISLGDPRVVVIASLGEPKSQAQPRELALHRDCELDETAPADTVEVWVKGLDLIFVVGYSEGRVVAKCSEVW